MVDGSGSKPAKTAGGAADITGDQVELIRRRLEEDVKAKVERDLFRYYRNLGSIVIAALGFVGVVIGWPQLKALVREQVESQVTRQVKAPVEAAQAVTADAEKMADKARRTAEEILARLEERQLELKDDIGRVNARYDEAAVSYGAHKSRLNGLNGEIDSLQQAVGYFRDLARKDPVSRAELDELKRSVASIAAQASDLASLLAALNGDRDRADALQQGLSSVAASERDSLKQQEAASKADPKGTSTVFVQFAGGRRKDIEAVSSALKKEGWVIPGEERIGDAAGLHEIRYFHDDDRAAAEMLQKDYNDALVAAGFKQTQVQVKEQTTQVKNLPARGVLEVWLQIPLLQGSE